MILRKSTLEILLVSLQCLSFISLSGQSVSAPDSSAITDQIRSIEKGILEGDIAADSAARVYSHKAEYYYKEGLISEAEQYLDRSSRYAIQVDDSALIHSNQLIYARLLMDRDDRAEAIGLLDTLYRTFEEDGDRRGMLNALRLLGNNYDYLGDHKTALDYYSQCVELAQVIEDLSTLSRVYSNMAGVYCEEGDYQQSIKIYEKALPIALKSGNYLSLFNIYQGMGIVYQDVELFQEARNYLKKCLEVAIAKKNKKLEGFALQSFGYYHQGLDNLDSAEYYMEQTKQIANQVNSDQLYVNALDVLQDVFYRTGRFQEAYDHFQELTAVNDSLYNLRNSKVIETIKSRYQSERNERELAEKNLQLAEAEYELTRNTILLISLVLLFLMKGGILVLLYRGYRNRKKANELLKLRNEEIESYNRKIKELHENKNRWFVNVAHELRTPLTLIKGPIKKIVNGRNQSAGDQKDDLAVIERNTDRMVNIISEILDLSRIEEGQMPMQYKTTNIRDLVAQTVASVDSAAAAKQVRIINDINQDIFMRLDPEKISRLLLNLVSNAIKHTSQGFVRLSADIDKDVRVVVEDNGIGISSGDLSNIFDRFYQSRDPNKNQQGGTGIGLALSKEIVEMHGGSIEVESSEGHGSRFTVVLPGKFIVSPEEDTATQFSTRVENDHFNQVIEKLSEKPPLLLVEDNADMRKFIGSLLEEDFTILEAQNGLEGMDQLNKHPVQIILSDVMMPEMDGSRFLKTVKETRKWSNLPFIHLSALDDINTRKESFRIGIDDYLQKPFDPEELVVRVRNLYRNYLNRIGEEATDEPLLSHDERILHKLKEEVIANLSDSSFSVWRLADCAAMSERQIYRFLKRNTGLTPLQFIQEIKLNKAMELINGRIYNSIGQLSQALGYQQSGYFSSVFEKRFGRKPANLLKMRS